MVGLTELVFLYANGIILAGMMYYAFTCIFKPAVGKVWILLAYITFLIATTQLFLLFDNMWITMIANIVSYIALSFLFSGNISTKVIFALFIYIIMVLAEGLTIVFFNMVYYIQYGLGATIEDILPVARTVQTIIQLPLVLAAIRMFRKYGNKKARYGDFTIPVHYTAIVALMLMGTVVISVLFIASTIDEIHTVFVQLTVALLLIAGVIVAIIWLYNTILNHLEEFEKNRIREQMQERWEVLYNTATSSQKTITKLRHNMRYDYLSLSGYLGDGDIQSAEKLIADRIGNLDTIISTGNTSIDTMLNYYKQRAQDMLGIDLELRHQTPPELNIDTNLMVLILGNALENAVEACLKVPKDRRYIKVIAEITAQDELLIMIANPYTIPPVSDGEGNLITTKENKQNHGLGLLSINDALPENIGQMHTEHKNGEFRFMLIIYEVLA
jgi:hypothetical protein